MNFPKQNYFLHDLSKCVPLTVFGLKLISNSQNVGSDWILPVFLAYTTGPGQILENVVTKSWKNEEIAFAGKTTSMFHDHTSFNNLTFVK